MREPSGKTRVGVIAGLSAAAFAIAAGAILSVSRAQLVASPWPMFQHGVAHTGQSTVSTSAIGPYALGRDANLRPETSGAAFKAPPASAPRASAAHNHPPRINFAQLPMRFERNDGQTDPQVKFLSRGQGYTLFITPGEAVLAMHSPSKDSRPDGLRSSRANSREPGFRITRAADTRRNDTKKDKAGESAVVRIALKGAASAPQIEGVDRLAAGSNYFIGNDPKKWHTDVPNYAKVELKNVYPGIDLIYHGGEQGRLEYDFRLAPGADPDAIRLGFKGMKKLALDKQGDLVVSVGKSPIVERAPAIYQEIGGNKQTVKGGWVLRGAHEAAFKIVAYDRSKPTVIDPVLLYSTYLGGSINDGGYGIAVDSSGNAYVTGYAYSTNFPTLNAFQSTNNSTVGGTNAFVAKFNPSASGADSLLYSTYLGGSGGEGQYEDEVEGDYGQGIAVDSSGNAYVTGLTFSTDFPTLNAYQSTNNAAANGGTNAFVAKLNPSASGAASLLYSTYLGGSGGEFLGEEGDVGAGIAVDSSGNAYVTGVTDSTGNSSCTGSGEPQECCSAAGTGTCVGFPTLNAFQNTNNSGSSRGGENAFVAKLNPSASGAASLLYSTYLGGSYGSYGDGGAGIAVDSSGNAYVTGTTFSTDFPTLNAYQSTNGGENVFVAKLNPLASGAASLLYSTYLGGNYFDQGTGIAVDSSGNAYVTGRTGSTGNSSCTGLADPIYCCTGEGTGTCIGFPTLNAYQSTLNGGTNAFVAKLNPSASGADSLLYSTYLGGTNYDYAFGIAVDSSSNAYVTGETGSANFPTLNAYQSTLNGVANAFVTQLNPSASGAASLLYSTYLGGFGVDGGFGIAVDSSGNAYVTGITSSIGNSSCTANRTPSLCCYGAGTGGCVGFPTLNAYQSTNNAAATGSSNAFVAELGPATPAPTPTATTATPTPSAAPTATPTTSISVPTTLSLGSSPVSDLVTKTLTVKNTGKTNPLFITNVTSTDADEFAPTGSTTCPAGGLAPSLTCTITIGFTPSTLGPRSATLQVFDNTSTSPQSVAVSGTGTIDISVSPFSYAFGSVKDGSKAIKTIVVHNYQNREVSLSEGLSGPNAGDFSDTGFTCGLLLAAKSSCTLVVTYAPTAVGAESSTLTVTEMNYPFNPNAVYFSAAVSLSSAATIPESLSVTTLNFAKVDQTASKTLSVTVTNHATEVPITLIGASIGGPNAGDFAVTGGNCPMPGGTLGASSSCTYAVTFTPSTEAAESSTLVIGVAEDPTSPRTVSLSGTGEVSVKLVPSASLSFGTLAPGHSSINKTVTVDNDGGAAVSLSESINGTNSADFAVTGGTCTTLPSGSLAGGGASCTYTLQFTPSIVGPESATLGVSAVGDAASPHNANLTGTGS